MAALFVPAWPKNGFRSAVFIALAPGAFVGILPPQRLTTNPPNRTHRHVCTGPFPTKLKPIRASPAVTRADTGSDMESKIAVLITEDS